MKKRYSDHIKLFADGYPILVQGVIGAGWRRAESPHDIVDAWAVKRATWRRETKRWVQQLQGEPVVRLVTPEADDREPRESWSTFISWIDTTWQDHEAPMPKGAPHVHAEVMKAWADGAKVRWAPVPGASWIYEGGGFVPQFCSPYIYQVAPEVVRYRRALLQHGAAPHVVMCFTEGESDLAGWQRGMETMGYTVHWIDTEWQTAEVPQGDSK